ncbi:hypothetical protein GCM10010977_21290 [Citricoccus zhacaiensis]|uniref:Uncharacterized protein n=1 Tax=Citricoccus zhacaiensis TaxID=489142 RepID=A0ABQ2M3F5_9MICC|nr:hypothetical protein GCM10010977_21290 [Citricoccus zhacaiensis]
MVQGNSFLVAMGTVPTSPSAPSGTATGCAFGKYGPNAHDTLNAAAAKPINTTSGTACFVDESGSGDPNGAFFATAGSRWARTDGGAGTSLYVKETGPTSAAGWVAK